MYKNIPRGPTYYSKTSDLCFYVLGNEENLIDSRVNITNKEVMKGDNPMPEGIYDAHMGTTDHSWNCMTCGNRKSICPGHFGSIDLKYPIKSPMYRDELLKWLKVTCYTCGELVVSLKKKIKTSKRLSELVKHVSSVKECPHCNNKHLQVYKDKKRPAVFYRVFDDGKIPKPMEFYNHEIEKVIQKINDYNVINMGRPIRSHPNKFILRNIRVPPNTIRPDIRRIGGARSSNSDTTSLLKTIVEINEALPDEIPNVEFISQDLKDMYFNLDMTYFAMIKGGGGGNIKLVTNTNKPPVSLAEHFPKKTGRIRWNLMGKFVEGMIRSVIVADCKLNINQVGIPILHARNLEIPETVSMKNIDILTMYFLNGIDRYPGCKRIKKKSDGYIYRVEHMDDNYQLQEGDVIMRDIIDGDDVILNRQPTLFFASMQAMKVVVMKVGDAIRINPCICKGFNADFDGDQMNALIPQNIMSRNEISRISKVSRWFISLQNQSPLFGAFQDGLLGLAEISKDILKFDKWHAMQVLCDINTDEVELDFKDNTYDNRHIISLLLPEINLLNKSPAIYKEQYANILKYNPNDISVNIKRGKLLSGILDKNTCGEYKKGSIFHIIANEYGNNKALDTVYKLQQLVNQFFLYHGFTTGINDINISIEAMKQVKNNIANIILESRKITEKLNTGKLIAPLGVSLYDFYESEQINSLNTGDDFINPIFADISLHNNGMAKMILCGSKGKPLNFIAYNGAIGTQTIASKRFGPQAGWGRTSLYFLRYDTDPAASGYISNSYREGVSSEVYAFIAGEARDGAISNALKTAVTGSQSRISIKNLETIIIDNIRKSTKGMNVVQPLYAECGINPAKKEKVKFPTIMLSDEEFENKYHTDMKKLNKFFHNKEIEKLLDDEFEQLRIDREKYRFIHLKLEDHNPRIYIMDNTKQMPINIERIIDDTIYNYSDVFDELDKKDKILDPMYVIKSVNNLCSNLGYTFLNEIQENAKSKIPEYISTSTNMLQILIRCYLCTSYLLSKDVVNNTLDIIINKIIITYKKSLIEYGTSIGVLAAQCLSEPMTQFVLNSKHRAGGLGGTSTDTIKRIQEILGAKDTESMKNTHMLILLKKGYDDSESKSQDIANHLEMMKFRRFISSTHIFFEEYGKPTHPEFMKERIIIAKIDKHNFGQNKPSDLAKWCIRYEINIEELILKSMKLETIILAIRKNYPNLFIIYSPENSDVIFIRCYFRNSMFKQTQDYYNDIVLPMMEELKNAVVRGVDGIISTSIIDIINNVRQPDGSLTREKKYGIYTAGTNFSKILENPYIDRHRTQTDSIKEIEKIFGITAARNKIINELISVSEDMNQEHCTIFADEMSYSGSVTSIQKTGLQKREMANISLRLSFQNPVQVIQDSAINGLIDRVSGVSGPLIMGTNPNIGTTYNSLYVNEDFIKENVKSIDNILEDL